MRMPGPSWTAKRVHVEDQPSSPRPPRHRPALLAADVVVLLLAAEHGEVGAPAAHAHAQRLGSSPARAAPRAAPRCRPRSASSWSRRSRRSRAPGPPCAPVPSSPATSRRARRRSSGPPAGRLLVLHLRVGQDGGGDALHVAAQGRREVRRDRLAREPAVRRRAQPLADADVPGERARRRTGT